MLHIINPKRTGCYGLIAALTFLVGRADVTHSADLECSVLTAGAGLIDMYCEHVPAIDGLSQELNASVVNMMRELTVSTFDRTDRCTDLFDRVSELGYFDEK